VISNTTQAAHSYNTFRECITLRDGDKCVVTNAQYFKQASHLIPKRLGSDGAVDIITRFSGTQAALGIDKFDPRIGILLSLQMDRLVDSYTAGFYHVAVSYPAYPIDLSIALPILPPYRAIPIPFIAFIMSLTYHLLAKGFPLWLLALPQPEISFIFTR
jgi:hypothetical protein